MRAVPQQGAALPAEGRSGGWQGLTNAAGLQVSAPARSAAGLHRLPVSSLPPDLLRGAAGSLWGGEIAAWALRFEEKMRSAKPPPYWAGAGLL